MHLFLQTLRNTGRISRQEIGPFSVCMSVRIYMLYLCLWIIVSCYNIVNIADNYYNSLCLLAVSYTEEWAF
jgi:hypothetical protein